MAQQSNRRSGNLLQKMALGCREIYEDQSARLSILAGALAFRPDTFAQTARTRSKHRLRAGRAIRFLRPRWRPRPDRDGAGAPTACDSASHATRDRASAWKR